jgi:hypothetical protein
MQRRNASVPFFARVVLAGTVAVSSLSCTRDSITAPRRRSAPSALAARAQTLAVTSASPAFGDQGTTVDVHVFGNGFTAGAQATWLLDGVADPGHVRTNSTTVLSSSELVANITIASDAQLAFWDVQVALSGGKNGVGSDAFEVTSAQILGAGTLGGNASARGINDQLQVVGTSAKPSSTAWIYDDANGMVKLGSGSAGGLDPLGAVVVGSNGSSLPTAWIRQPDNTWSAQALPLVSGGLQGEAMSAARLGDGTLVAAGWNSVSGKRVNTTYPNRPVLWQQINGTWSNPQILQMPAGAASATARDVNALGQVTGVLDAPAPGIVWDSPTSYVLLDGTPGRVNSSGTLIVGQRLGDFAPVYWWRDPVTHAWHATGAPLPSLGGAACTSGYARDVNDAGVIVGWSCDSSGGHRATVWQLDLSGASPALASGPALLPGLGTKTSPGTEVSVAAGITESAPYVVAGYASSGGITLAVRWLLR